MKTHGLLTPESGTNVKTHGFLTPESAWRPERGPRTYGIRVRSDGWAPMGEFPRALRWTRPDEGIPACAPMEGLPGSPRGSQGLPGASCSEIPQNFIQRPHSECLESTVGHFASCSLTSQNSTSCSFFHFLHFIQCLQLYFLHFHFRCHPGSSSRASSVFSACRSRQFEASHGEAF